MSVLRGQQVKPIPPLTSSSVSRFFRRVEFNENGCWLWPTRDRLGYGQFGIGERKYLAHRVAYIIAHGEIPPGCEIDHICNERACCNPLHLQALTTREHIDQTVERRSACRSGHTYVDGSWFVNHSGRRECRICAREKKARWQRAWRARERANGSS